MLTFDNNGLKYGLRGKKDGYAFFGTSTHFYGKIINDYVLNIKSFNYKEGNSSMTINSSAEIENDRIPVIYFVVYYDSKHKKFYLQNIRKINYNELDKFIFPFAVYKKLVTNRIKINDKILISFNENFNHALGIQKIENDQLKVCLIKINSNENDPFENKVIVKLLLKNNGVSITIGNNGNIKVDLQGNSYYLCYNKNEKYWELKNEQDENRIFWILIDKKIDLYQENIFRINSQLFKISCKYYLSPNKCKYI